jgi:phosphoglycerol transferase MdoB-like AlkP superfamily enzyme
MSDVDTARPGIVGRLAVMVVAGALFAYPFWTALGNLLNLPSYYQAQFGASVDTVPWALLIAGVALPALTFLGATVIGWKRGAGSMALLLTAGFAAVSATALSILAFEKDIELRLVIDFLVNG